MEYETKSKFGSPELLTTLDIKDINPITLAESESNTAQYFEPCPNPEENLLVLILIVENNSGEISEDHCLIYIEDSNFY